jgi:hypothetical protein
VKKGTTFGGLVESLVETEQQPSNFIRFPERVDILDALCTIESYSPDYEPLFAQVAERLANRAYDRSAFVFILIELIYEFEVTDHEFGQLLSQAVLALTGDMYLAGSALDAYQEVKITLAPIAEVEEEEDFSKEAAPESVSEESTDRLSVRLDRDIDPEGLMTELQQAQKRISDLGLLTRMSIEMTLGRPGRSSVQGTLKRISALRAALRDFEEHLREGEDRILRVIGVLEEET